jgi:hypothetical protein
MQDQTRSVVAGLVADLIDAFPRSPIGASTPKLYVRELSDIPPAHLERAVRHLIRTSTEPWLPQIGYAALRNADNPGAARGSFLRHYRAIRGRAIAGAQTGAALEVGPRLAALG